MVIEALDGSLEYLLNHRVRMLKNAEYHETQMARARMRLECIEAEIERRNIEANGKAFSEVLPQE